MLSSVTAVRAHVRCCPEVQLALLLRTQRTEGNRQVPRFVITGGAPATRTAAVNGHRVRSVSGSGQKQGRTKVEAKQRIAAVLLNSTVVRVARIVKVTQTGQRDTKIHVGVGKVWFEVDGG